MVLQPSDPILDPCPSQNHGSLSSPPQIQLSIPSVDEPLRRKAADRRLAAGWGHGLSRMAISLNFSFLF